METIDGRKDIPIKTWAPFHTIEEQARTQLLNLSELPFVYKHIAVMPDVHTGVGSTIGSVIATKNAVIPAAVGVDIGCGVMAVKTPFTASQLPDQLNDLRTDIEWGVPVGFNEHRQELDTTSGWVGWKTFGQITQKVQEYEGKARRQLGTLGGGNHFIEVCLDTEQNVWVMLHSGSRNIGNRIAQVYINEAKLRAFPIDAVVNDPHLAWLDEGSSAFNDYWRDLQWAQAYAMINRQAMMDKVLKSLAQAVFKDWRIHVERLVEVNCHHNYAERESHFGEDVIVTRKGAVRAQQGDFGIIPGSMGTRSFIVKGLGHPDSFCSCSHGAGRRMSRTKAKQFYTEADIVEQTKGVECKKDRSVLDEIPGAYKDIDEVMANQKDLVEIVAELKQVLCVKG